MANQQTPAPDAAAAAPAKPKLPVLIGMVAVGLLVGGGTGAAFVGPIVAKKMGKSAPVVAHADGEHADSTADEAAATSEGGEAPAEGEVPALLLLENLVLNPAASGGGRYLLFSVAIEAGSSKASEEFAARDAELRDLILTALGVKTVEELTEIASREQFKAELLTVINAKFGKKAVKSLYFPQFVVQ
ncbi:flagellar basal body-associated FliL family protein [Gemmatimonas sp.]|uniref:flagellar basal body-associated FliL family protein n=1 Tax=Gemmatimonas sp. TaxID=1962908 RepID=UPI0022CAA852|nr:flagellar basal body-associated FliL family protein [Gemmatimonas sp.]MCZ8203868.1 flagellar basal body-associated FliL family protein [Gemmatimonas sp.]